MRDPEIEIIVSDRDLEGRDLAFAVIAAGLLVAFWAGIAAWLGSYLLCWIAITGLWLALGAGIWLAMEQRRFKRRARQEILEAAPIEPEPESDQLDLFR